MKEILDQEQFTEEIPISATFAKLAFAVAILTLGLGSIITYLIIQVPDSLIDVDRRHLIIMRICSLTFVLSLIAGLVFSIASLARKEKLKYFKPIGIGLNFSYWLVIIALILYAVYIEPMRY